MDNQTISVLYNKFIQLLLIPDRAVHAEPSRPFAMSGVPTDARTAPNGTSVDNATDTMSLEDVLYYSYYFTLLFTVSAVAIGGNILVIQAMVRYRHLRGPENYFLFSLALSDLLLGLVYPIYNFGHINSDVIQQSLGHWPSCTVIMSLTMMLLFISSYNLVGITVTRYISIRDPLKFPLHLTHSRALTAVCVTWAALVLVAGVLFLRTQPPPDYTDGECRYEHLYEAYTIILTTCFYVIAPLIIMAVMYGHMTVIARKQMRIIVKQQILGGHHPGLTYGELLMRKEMRMFKVAATLLGYFIFAWTPFVVFEFISIIGGVELNRWIRATVRIILHSNAGVNVLIYAGRLQDFRRAIKENLRRMRSRCCKRSQDGL